MFYKFSSSLESTYSALGNVHIEDTLNLQTEDHFVWRVKKEYQHISVQRSKPAPVNDANRSYKTRAVSKSRGHDVGNVPLQESREERSSSQHVNDHFSMESFDRRLRSFAGRQFPVDLESLARAGFYSTGTGDMVICFHCGEGLKYWQPGEDPWELHARYYPGCSFLLAEKGQEFINSIQLQGPQQSSANSSNQNGFSGNKNGIPQSQLEMAQKAIEMGIEPSLVKKIIVKKINCTGSGYSSMEALVADCFHVAPKSKMTRAQGSNTSF